MNASHPARKPRVLLVSGPASGGIRRHLEVLLSEMPSHGFELAAAAPASVRLPGTAIRLPLEIGDRPRPAHDLLALLALRRAAGEWRPDLVHAHGVKAALLALAVLGASRPVAVTFHNLWHGGPLTRLLRPLMSRARASVTVSSSVAASLSGQGVPLPGLAVIPNGVDLSFFRPAPAPVVTRPLPVAFIGRLSPEKGVHTLLEATALRGVREHVRIVVDGDGPLRGEVEAAAARGYVTYLGRPDEVLPVYHAAGAVVIPSLSEGQSLVALEAMACGLPVVASRVGGLPEVVAEGDTGVLVPPGQPDALAGTLLELAADPDRRRALGTAGRRRVEEMFDQQRMLERIAALYRTLL